MNTAQIAKTIRIPLPRQTGGYHAVKTRVLDRKAKHKGRVKDRRDERVPARHRHREGWMGVGRSA